jgi:serine phosphatase RsbU (regulator of sigma subunit)/anti-sigma regulatory factor (Ser/Thr protein kinase)
MVGDAAGTTTEPDAVRRARSEVTRRARELGRDALADDAALVVSELVTNALLHGGGCTAVDVVAIDGGLRVEVRDASPVPPRLGRPTEESLTGRGLRLVARLAAQWGTELEPAGGKVIWADITGHADAPDNGLTDDELLAMWDTAREPLVPETRFHVELGDVPTDLLLSAKSHVDNLVREFALANAGARSGMTAEVPPHLASLVSSVVDRFSEARLAIKRQALEAAGRGEASTSLALDLPASAADAAEEYARALDEVDAYCRARRLLTLETPPQHRVFRHWYIDELVRQLRGASKGGATGPPVSFTRRLLNELDRVAGAQQASQRAAPLYSLTAALATAASSEAVASAVLNEGVAALGASGGALLLAAESDRLLLPGAVGYDEELIARLRGESPDAELPAAVALRTGEAVWLESRTERDERFPQLAGMEASTVALCAVPLEVQGKNLGALRFSFSQARLFDHEERRFVLALAAQTAQALHRAQLQRGRLDVSRRLQRSLLPPTVPAIPGLEVAAIYNPFGDGMDVGGDFYDMWPAGAGRWAIAIGDAAGTGPEAAALTALVRYTLRALTMNRTDPADVVRTLNTALLDANPDPENERFCTVIFGVVTVEDGVQVQLACGGHPRPLLRRADGRVDTVPLEGSLLGVFAEPEVNATAVRIEAGDLLLLVTDGVLEARWKGEQFGVEGVVDVLSRADFDSAEAAALALETAVLRHTGGTLTDDMAAVALRVPDAGS